ncbi:hypothetical protein AX16_008087 [Volvariella volvacea WC 439]|nr:hypothetical protein AX16_008087 [Volvariella volvacea WC 439]
MHDTLKKPRELLSVAYAVRFPELAAKSKHPGGEVDLESMEPHVVEHDRQRLLAVERLILETVCFNFTSRMPFPYVIKMSRVLGASKRLCKLSWRLAIDCFRTLLPIQYPPHTVALGCIYVASLLTSFEQPPEPPVPPGLKTNHEVAALLSDHGNWEAKFQVQVSDLEDIAHTMLDLMIQGVQNPSANTSPSTPSSPSPHSSTRLQSAGHASQSIPSPYKSDQLIRLKIVMREREHPPRVRQPLGTSDPSALYTADDTTTFGRNEGTVRFLFGPPGVVGNGV